MIRILLLTAVFLGVMACGGNKTQGVNAVEKVTDSAWKMALEAFRKEKDNGFAMAAESPFADDALNFKGLKYFNPDPKYRVVVKLVADPASHSVREIADSKGEKRKLHVHGKLRFQLLGRDYDLPALTAEEDSLHYFVMFRDLTNGTETYEGGRYLEIPVFKDSGLLDFNAAYNPYCHYNHNYACPIVPVDCKLNVAVKAGERVYR